jgi:hypothetical protein
MILRLLLTLQWVMRNLIRFCQLTIISAWIKVIVLLLSHSVTSCLALDLDIIQVYAAIFFVGDLWRLTDFTQKIAIWFLIILGTTNMLLIVNLNFFLLYRYRLRFIMMRLWGFLGGGIWLWLVCLGLSERGLLVFNRRVLAILKTHLLFSCQ